MEGDGRCQMKADIYK